MSKRLLLLLLLLLNVRRLSREAGGSLKSESSVSVSREEFLCTLLKISSSILILLLQGVGVTVAFTLISYYHSQKELVII